MPAPNGAGDLPLDAELKGALQTKKGQTQDNPRGGSKPDMVVKVSDGFGVLPVQIDMLVQLLGMSQHLLFSFN